MLRCYSLVLLGMLPLTTAALAADPAVHHGTPVPQQTAAKQAPVLTVPPPDFSTPRPDKLAPMDDIPSSGSSSQYVHGPNEGPVPGASQYRLGGPPPNAQGLLGGP